ncbi:hypothetical protein LTR04_001107, partial [Oleoguttula sp. CCFEE 6159]
PDECKFTRKVKKRGKAPRAKPLTQSLSTPALVHTGHEVAGNGLPNPSQTSQIRSYSAIWDEAQSGTMSRARSPQSAVEHRVPSSVADVQNPRSLADSRSNINLGITTQSGRSDPNDRQALYVSNGVERLAGFEIAAEVSLHPSQTAPSIDDRIMDYPGLSPPQGHLASSVAHDHFPPHDVFGPDPQRRNGSQTSAKPSDDPSGYPRFQPVSRTHSFVSAVDKSAMHGGVLMQNTPSPGDVPRSASDMYDFGWKSTGATSTYPVLRPLLPYVRSFLTGPQAAGLLELYFFSTFSIHMHPVCRHVHAYIFRKSSVLHPTNPRPCSPALLASMLCAAAETGGAEMLSWSITRRRKVSRKLYILSIQLLKPLVHFDIGCAHMLRDENDPTSAGNPTCRPAGSKPGGGYIDAHRDAPPLAETEGSLDDVVTYIHIASITSASEHKAASMRWWHAAFTLSRELKFNKEVSGGMAEHDPSCPRHAGYSQSQMDAEPDIWTGLESYNFEQGLFNFMENVSTTSDCDCGDKSWTDITEEAREEQRRVWWLLYIMDRHLALCYNRPLSLLDAECELLLLPLDEVSWQSSFDDGKLPVPKRRASFPSFECTDHNIYGFFLPLMTIVGEIIDLNHAKNHPLLGLARQGPESWGTVEAEILRQLNLYLNSLPVFEAAHSSPDGLPARGPSQESLHTKMVIAYATHVTHVLFILLAGKWDPVSLFDDRDSWISSPSFTSTMQHAISAADA